jgi:hypothetical protein
MKRLGYQLAVAACLIGPASAADPYTPEPIPTMTEPGGFEAGWEFAASMYLWAPSISGSVDVVGLDPVDVDASFMDLLENLDMAFMAVAEARYDRVGIFGDLMYTKLSAGGEGPLGIFEADVTNEMIVGTLMGEYRLIDAGAISFDVMAGARIWSVSADLDVTSTVGDPPLGLSADGDQYWVDPMIGMKGRLQGASPWYLTGWAMIGGFGLSSEIDWDVFGGLGYQFNDTFSFVVGYRGVGVDYEDDGFEFDVIQQGPILGGVFRF